MKRRSIIDMHKNLISEAISTFPTNKLPVRPQVRDVPLVSQDVWQNVVDGELRFLQKKMTFTSNIERNVFMCELLAFEDQFGHNAREIWVTDCTIVIRLSSDDALVPLDDDRAYSMFVDDLYRDVSFPRLLP